MDMKEYNCLELMFFYNELSEEYYWKFRDLLNDYECNSDFVFHGYEVEFNRKDYFVVVETTNSVNEWLKKYHESFANSLGLKLVKVEKRYTRVKKPIQYKYLIYYTFKNNPTWVEMDVDEFLDKGDW